MIPLNIFRCTAQRKTRTLPKKPFCGECCLQAARAAEAKGESHFRLILGQVAL
jgi:hypothetical protein